MSLIYKSDYNNYYIDSDAIITKYNNKTNEISIIQPYLHNKMLYVTINRPQSLDKLFIQYILQHDITGCYITSYHKNNDLHDFEDFRYDIFRTKKGFEHLKTAKNPTIFSKRSENLPKIYTLKGNSIEKSSNNLKDFEELFTDSKYIHYLQLIENQDLTYLNYTLTSHT
jgi:hypothetical protein